MSQYLQVLWMLLDPRVTRVPRRVLKKLRDRGIQRLPGDVQNSFGGLLPGIKALAFVHRWLDGERISRHNGQWIINSFLPPFPGAAFDRMFENLLSGRRLSPVSAFLAVSNQCTYHCWHCSFKNRAAGALDTPSWMRILTDLQQLGASVIGFTGGEPCLREDLPILIAAASKGGAATIVFSSGAAIDQPLIHKLRDAGLWSLCISLDHPSPEEHDRLRGAPGSHAQARAALKWASAAGLYTMVGTVATRELLRDDLLPRIHRLAHECGAHELRLMEPMPCGLLARDSRDALLRPEDIQSLKNFHIQSNRQGKRPKVCAFNRVESPELFGCGAGTQHLFIDSAGEVCPCDFTAMSFGNAAREPLGQIWAEMSGAMGNPRRNCFVQKHYDLILKHGNGRFPLTPAQSKTVCAEAGREPLPDYFQLLSGRKE